MTCINFNAINRIILFFAFTVLLSCQPDDQPTGVAAGASGQYLVTAYIVSGDTLFSSVQGPTGFKTGINRIGVDNFTVVINATGPDQLTIRTSYWRNGLRSTFSKEVVVRLTNYDYQFSLVKPGASSVYEGRVGRFTKFFYEQTVGGGILIPLATSPSSSSQTSSQAVIIIAQPAG